MKYHVKVKLVFYFILILIGVFVYRGCTRSHKSYTINTPIDTSTFIKVDTIDNGDIHKAIKNHEYDSLTINPYY